MTEEQMAALFGRGEDPITHQLLGRPYPVFRSWRERVHARVANLNPGLDPHERTTAIEQIEIEESDRRTHQAVAGFDLTFSPAKSVSALWAIADTGTQEQIVKAHHEAINDTLALIETEAAHTRTGGAGIAQIDTRGLIAAAFDHWDSRCGDPQLHTHMVVANRVQGLDGRWRSLDGRSLYRACVAMSETYNDLLADKLALRLGVEWDHRERGNQANQTTSLDNGQPGRRGQDRNPAWEIDGVPDALLEEFSARTSQIEANLQTLIARHKQVTGRAPGRAQMYTLRQQATLMDRPSKDAPQPLSDLVPEWRRRAERNARAKPAKVIANAVNRSHTRPLTAAQLAPETLAAYAATVVMAVQQRRSTWTRWNLIAEAARQTRALRLATARDRITVLDAIADHAQTPQVGSVSLAAPDLLDVHNLPEVLRRRDGQSVFTVHNSDPFTSTAILGAEALLLDLAHSRTGPVANPNVPDTARTTTQPPDKPPDKSPPDASVFGPVLGPVLGPDQAAAVRRIATSRQVVEAMIGPAGAGKTTTLAALRRVWEAEHGPGSVLGLAPSAAAAEVLGEPLGISTENTAKWIHETVGQGARDRADWLQRCEQTVRSMRQAAPTQHRQSFHDRQAHQGRQARRNRQGGRDRQGGRAYERALATLAKARAEADLWRLRPGQLVIVDEASLAGTTQLATLARQAEHAGAKLLLVGDDAQLSAVESGGAFRLIARDTNSARLTEVWRFTHAWERDACLQLRDGDPDAITAYTDHGRITNGDIHAMRDAAYSAWHADEQQGRRSLLIAADNDTVAALNTRARLDRITTGLVEPGGVRLRDGTEAGVGDRIITRLNQRRITTNHGRYIRNGNQWIVTKRWRDGSLTVQTNNPNHPGGTRHRVERVTLPAAYVAESVELGYATTAHRAQGATVDTAHLLVTENLSREVLYVAMTRGRVANHAYVVTANTHDEPHQHRPERTARDVLEDILSRPSAERSAYEVMRDELDTAGRLDRMVPIHDHMSQIAASTRYRAALKRCGLPDEHHSEVIMSPAYGPLLAALRHAESRGLNPEHVLHDAIALRPFDHVRDIAAVLHWRIDRIVHRAERHGQLHPDTTIAGLVTPATNITDPILAAALRDTENLIADRARHLAEQAVQTGPSWLRPLGQPPHDDLDRAKWDTLVARIAAYRERHNVRGPDPLGPAPSPKDYSHSRDWHRLRDMIQAAPTRSGTTPTVGQAANIELDASTQTRNL